MSSTETAVRQPEAVEPARATYPFISVIVPTYNRGRVLPHLFSALAHQLYPADRMELIVVDNSSSDDTEQVVARWARVLPFEVRFYRKDNKGPAASRNYGAARARGEVLAFTDSDCLPVPAWLRGAARGFGDGAGIVCGPFIPLHREGEGVLIAQQPPVTGDRGCYPTANLLVRKADFERVHGFDEKFGLYPWGELIAGEDADLAWRVRRNGVKVAFLSDVLVGHLSTPMSFWRLLLRPIVVQIIPALLPKIPELREVYLWNRYFNAKIHLYFHVAWIAILAALLTHWWPLALGALPWAWFYLRSVLVPGVRFEGWRNGVARTALFIYLQVACSLVLIFASFRYRRLVL